VFKENCIGCHSINLVGGDLAPELNVPKNVTEYWRADDIRALVRDASSFRARSKMPPFPQLGAGDIDDLLHYFAAMKSQKVCDAGRPCPN
jgi:mono/diheme cytochrome c family protein